MARSGPCSPWITAGDVANNVKVLQAIANYNDQNDTPLTTDQINALCSTAAEAATEVLYRLTAMMYTGACGPVTIRPVARPLNNDARAWLNAWGYGAYANGVFQSFAVPPVVSSFGPNYLPVIELFDYPVNEISEVKIDGVVIPPDEYELRAQRHLVRLRTSATAVPTEIWGWPYTQVQDLPDTEEGTFSVTYTYGQDPGSMGRVACTALAVYLVLPQLGDVTQFPERVVTINRQGTTVQIASPIDMIAKGQTGIEEVDLWVLSVNPNKRRRQALVFSPDRPSTRRTASPTIT